MKEYFCILGGGGVRGAAYTGVIKALDELDIKVTGYAGSSIGSVVAGLLTFGYSADEIKDIFENIDFGIFKDLNFKFGKDFALSKGGNFYDWMKNKIEQKFFKPNETKRPVTFQDAPVELVIFSVDLVTSKLIEFSKEKTPNVEVAHAIRVSSAMPGLYSPVCDEFECLVDGDLAKSMPFWMASSTIFSRSERILEFRLENNGTKKKITNTFEYLNAVYDSMTGIATDFLIDTYKDYDRCDFIKLNLEGVSVIDFMANKEKKREMVKTGYDTTIAYFKEKYPKKKEQLKAIYGEILAVYKKIEFYLSNKNYKEARYLSADILGNLARDYNKIDRKILFSLIEFKKIIDNNYIVKNGIFGKKDSLIQYREVLEAAGKIIYELNNFVV